MVMFVQHLAPRQVGSAGGKASSRAAARAASAGDPLGLGNRPEVGHRLDHGRAVGPRNMRVTAGRWRTTPAAKVAPG